MSYAKWNALSSPLPRKDEPKAVRAIFNPKDPTRLKKYGKTGSRLKVHAPVPALTDGGDLVFDVLVRRGREPTLVPSTRDQHNGPGPVIRQRVMPYIDADFQLPPGHSMAPSYVMCRGTKKGGAQHAPGIMFPHDRRHEPFFDATGVSVCNVHCKVLRAAFFPMHREDEPNADDYREWYAKAVETETTVATGWTMSAAAMRCFAGDLWPCVPAALRAKLFEGENNAAFCRPIVLATLLSLTLGSSFPVATRNEGVQWGGMAEAEVRYLMTRPRAELRRLLVTGVAPFRTSKIERPTELVQVASTHVMLEAMAAHARAVLERQADAALDPAKAAKKLKVTDMPLVPDATTHLYHDPRFSVGSWPYMQPLVDELAGTFADVVIVVPHASLANAMMLCVDHPHLVTIVTATDTPLVLPPDSVDEVHYIVYAAHLMTMAQWATLPWPAVEEQQNKRTGGERKRRRVDAAVKQAIHWHLLGNTAALPNPMQPGMCSLYHLVCERRARDVKPFPHGPCLPSPNALLLFEAAEQKRMAALAPFEGDPQLVDEVQCFLGCDKTKLGLVFFRREAPWGMIALLATLCSRAMARPRLFIRSGVQFV